MKKESVFRSILHLAWPTMLEQAMQTAVQYVDYAMVGSTGAASIAAIGVTNTVTWLVNSPLWACATGFLACVAKDVGAKDLPHARRTSAQAVLVATVLGLIMAVLCVALSPFIPRWMGAEAAIQKNASLYFGIVCAPLMFRSLLYILSGVIRGSGDTRTPMLVNLFVNLINLALNYLMIYPARRVSLFGADVWMPGLGLGVTGAAIATAISYVFGGAALLVVLMRHKKISPRGCRFLPDKEILRPCFRITVPNVLQRVVTCFGQVTFASMVNSLGTLSVTAHSTAITAESAFYIPGYGIQAAASALTGNAYGAKDRDRMRRLSRTLLGIVFCLMIFTGTMLFLLAEKVMGLFVDDPEVISLGATVLKMVAVSEPVYGVAIILEGIFHGVGDTLYPFWAESACMWGVRIVGTFITVKLMGMRLPAAWGCMIAHNSVLAALMAIHYVRGRWNPLNRQTAEKSAA